MSKPTDAFICDAIRSPFGRYGGSLASVRADDLAALPIAALMARNLDVDWSAVDDLYYGAFSRAAKVEDTTLGWRFVNPLMKAKYGIDSMPETAENVAKEFGISRADQDAFALRSQQRWALANAAGVCRAGAGGHARPGAGGRRVACEPERRRHRHRPPAGGGQGIALIVERV